MFVVRPRVGRSPVVGAVLAAVLVLGAPRGAIAAPPELDYDELMEQAERLRQAEAHADAAKLLGLVWIGEVEEAQLRLGEVALGETPGGLPGRLAGPREAGHRLTVAPHLAPGDVDFDIRESQNHAPILIPRRGFSKETPPPARTACRRHP